MLILPTHKKVNPHGGKDYTLSKYKFGKWGITLDKSCPLLYLAVSGSHAYGWERDDSDLDLREVWIPSHKQVLSLHFNSRNVIESKIGKDIDYVSMCIQHFLYLLLKKGNGNSLENLFQYHIVEKLNLVKQLQEVAMENLHNKYIKHYIGYTKHLLHDVHLPNRIKSKGVAGMLLQAYRTILTGTLLNHSRVLEWNINKLNNIYSIENIDILKRAYMENSDLNIPIPHIIRDIEERKERLSICSRLPNVVPFTSFDKIVYKYYGVT